MSEETENYRDFYCSELSFLRIFYDMTIYTLKSCIVSI